MCGALWAAEMAPSCWYGCQRWGRPRISARQVDDRFAAVSWGRCLAGPLPSLTVRCNCLRAHSYVCPLIEDGVDPPVSCQQPGRAKISWASNHRAALYDGVADALQPGIAALGPLGQMPYEAGQWRMRTAGDDKGKTDTCGHLAQAMGRATGMFATKPDRARCGPIVAGSACRASQVLTAFRHPGPPERLTWPPPPSPRWVRTLAGPGNLVEPVCNPAAGVACPGR